MLCHWWMLQTHPVADTGMLQDALTDRARDGPAGPARHLAEELGVDTAVPLEGLSDVAAVEAGSSARPGPGG